MEGLTPPLEVVPELRAERKAFPPQAVINK